MSYFQAQQKLVVSKSIHPTIHPSVPPSVRLSGGCFYYSLLLLTLCESEWMVFWWWWRWRWRRQRQRCELLVVLVWFRLLRFVNFYMTDWLASWLEMMVVCCDVVWWCCGLVCLNTFFFLHKSIENTGSMSQTDNKQKKIKIKEENKTKCMYIQTICKSERNIFIFISFPKIQFKIFLLFSVCQYLNL